MLLVRTNSCHMIGSCGKKLTLYHTMMTFDTQEDKPPENIKGPTWLSGKVFGP